MKTVSGKVVSCQQISLSRAAKYISRFTTSDNEASPAFAAYLRRTSAAFNHLVQLHKEYKIPLGESKHNQHNSTSIVGKPKVKKCDEVHVDEHSRNVERFDSAVSEMQSGGRIIDGDVRNNVHGGLNKSTKKKERDGDAAAAMDNGGDHDAINERRLDGTEEMNLPDVGDVGKKSKKKRASDGDVASTDKVKRNGVDDVIKVSSEVKNEMGSLDASEQVKNNVPDLDGTGKKSKKKRGNDQSHDAINPNVVENKMESLDAGEDVKKKKKSKREKHQKENHSGASETLKEVQLHPHRQADDTVQNNSDEQKKHKKSKSKDDRNVRNEVKEEKESSSIKSAEQIKEIHFENKDKIIGQMKQRYEAEGREHGRDMETEAAGKKESRKRKHERVADGELVGSQEAVRSKKKKL
ncbi:hypothetical protein RND81_05G272000 [Saponaria officinalis]|uniref:Uncharacterized protein n=1 Tax=Saponaria officinalis TaxID=3572 RepID=A0AAW1L434_SAPOF